MLTGEDWWYLLVADPGADGNAAPAHATIKAAHVGALATPAVPHGDGTRAAAVERGTEHVADGAVAFRHAGAAVANGHAVGVELVGRLAEVTVGLGFSQRRGQIGGLVLRRVGAIAGRRLDVDGGGGLCHVAQEAAVLRWALGKQGNAAVTRVFEEKVELGLTAGHKLVRLALPGVGNEGRVLGSTAKMGQDRLLGGGGDRRARCGGFARRVGEGWRRGLVGIQLHGEKRETVGRQGDVRRAGGRSATVWRGSR